MEARNKQREEKLHGGEIAMPHNRPGWLEKALKWLDNFWYHYKWPFLISLFFIITFAVCLVQCSTRTTSDAYIAFADGAELNSAERSSVEQVLSLLVQKTFEENPFSVGFSSYSFFDEEELKAFCTYTDPKTGKPVFDNYEFQLAKNANQGRYKSFGDYVMTGDCVIWLVDSYVYEYKLKSLAVPLKDTFGENGIDGAYDATAIRLGDLEIYQHYKALQVLPEDTLLVLSKPFVYGAASNQEFYQRMVTLYRAIVEFEAP